MISVAKVPGIAVQFDHHRHCKLVLSDFKSCSMRFIAIYCDLTLVLEARTSKSGSVAGLGNEPSTSSKVNPRIILDNARASWHQN